LIVIHGGCWRSFGTPRIMRPFAKEMTSEGFATWSLEYRPVDAADRGWPNTFLDIADGIDHLRKIKEQYNLDLENVIVTGHSAGGHLALWTAGRHRIGPSSVLYRRDPLPVAAVVSLAGVGDLAAARPLDNSVCGGDVIDDLVGGSPDEVSENYAAGSPIQLLPLGVPQRLLTGNADESVPPWLGNAYAIEARRAGDDVEAVTLDGSAHFEIIAPGSVVWDEVRRTILEMRRP
jgi:acetyl esterase/lipase